MSDHEGPIYHLAPASELHAGCTRDRYAPARLAEDGFVHCAGTPEVALAVADDYFADLDEPLAVLEIDPSALQAELRFEAPAPLPGGGREHLAKAEHFPHVYGPLDRGAITAAGWLRRGPDGFAWPTDFDTLASLLAGR